MTSVLKLFCRRPGSSDYPMKGVGYEEGQGLARALEVFPDFREKIRGAHVLDFGCGRGYQVAAMAEAAAVVDGVDCDLKQLSFAEELVNGRGRLFAGIPAEARYDVIYSQNSAEHWIEPEQVLRLLRAHLVEQGRIYVTFAPPWLAPYGAHMGFFTRLPWVHLLFSEHTVMKVRSIYRSDGSQSYTECGLARMTLRKFERVVASSGLQILLRRYDCVRKMNVFSRVPLLREFFVNRASYILALRANLL